MIIKLCVAKNPLSTVCGKVLPSYANEYWCAENIAKALQTNFKYWKPYGVCEECMEDPGLQMLLLRSMINE